MSTTEHYELPLYTVCGHAHDEGEPGTVMVGDGLPVCESAYVTSVCGLCCPSDTPPQVQGRHCLERHTGPCWPCPRDTNHVPRR